MCWFLSQKVRENCGVFITLTAAPAICASLRRQFQMCTKTFTHLSILFPKKCTLENGFFGTTACWRHTWEPLKLDALWENLHRRRPSSVAVVGKSLPPPPSLQTEEQGWGSYFWKELSYNCSFFQMRNLGTSVTSVTVTTYKSWLKK